jgi:hypothetical protein
MKWILGALALIVASPAPALEGGGRVGDISFNRTHITGPGVNLSRRSDGTWAGKLGYSTVGITEAAGRLTGVQVNLSYESTNEALTIKGLWFSNNVRIELGQDLLTVRIGRFGSDFRRAGASRENCAVFMPTEASRPGAVELCAGADTRPVELTLALVALFTGGSLNPATSAAASFSAFGTVPMVDVENRRR